MSSIYHHAGQLNCMSPPRPPDALALGPIVSWTGWAGAAAAIIDMIAACVRLRRLMSRGTDCGDDPTSAHITRVLVACVLVAVAGSLVGAIFPR